MTLFLLIFETEGVRLADNNTIDIGKRGFYFQSGDRGLKDYLGNATDLLLSVHAHDRLETEVAERDRTQKENALRERFKDFLIDLRRFTESEPNVLKAQKLISDFMYRLNQSR